MDGHGGADRVLLSLGSGSGTPLGGDGRELDEHECRYGSDHDMDDANSDDQGTDHEASAKKPDPKYRHTPQQIKELEAFFMKSQMPNRKQIDELSTRLSLRFSQVKFWFQNHRTQIRNYVGHNENVFLKQENDKLKAEIMNAKEAMRNPTCNNCGGALVLGQVCIEEQRLRNENARLKEELNRACAQAGLDLAAGVNGYGGMTQGMGGVNLELTLNNNHQFRGDGVSGGMPCNSIVPYEQQFMSHVGESAEKSSYFNLAMAAMEELIHKVQTDEPLWIPCGLYGGRETLNHDEYMRMFRPCIGVKPNGFVTEASRETSMVMINTVSLVETLMDAKRYLDMFPCVIGNCSITGVISSGIGGTRNGALQLMHAEFQVLSPLVPIREVNFLRFCKQRNQRVWVVVDISVDAYQETSDSSTTTCLSRRLPSGCVIQDMDNGYSKVTWVEHTDYDDYMIHPLYKPLVILGLGFGAQKWIATLQRQCECGEIRMSNMPSKDEAAIVGRESILKMAQRMTKIFIFGVCSHSVHNWRRQSSAANVVAGVTFMSRRRFNNPGEPEGVILSAAKSVWLPISPLQLFNFLRDENSRSKWDSLSDGARMQLVSHITKGEDPGNCISLLRSGDISANQSSSTLILQEACIDASGSLVVYAPVSMHGLMSCGDSSCVELLPCGFAIVPDGRPSALSLSNHACADRASSSNKNYATSRGCGSTSRQLTDVGGGGSLLTVAFQILADSLPTDEITEESVDTLSYFISMTVQKIKDALHCEI